MHHPRPLVLTFAAAGLLTVLGGALVRAALIRSDVGEERPQDTPTPAADAGAYYLTGTPEDLTRYTHPATGLSFRYPRDFVLETFPQDGGEVILAEHPHLDMGLQIVIAPLDDPTLELTPDTLTEDYPEVADGDIIQTELADVTPVLRFPRRDPALGELRDAVFIRQGTLYQITMHAANTEMLDAWIRHFVAVEIRFPEEAQTPASDR